MLTAREALSGEAVPAVDDIIALAEWISGDSTRRRNADPDVYGHG